MAVSPRMNDVRSGDKRRLWDLNPLTSSFDEELCCFAYSGEEVISKVGWRSNFGIGYCQSDLSLLTLTSICL